MSDRQEQAEISRILAAVLEIQRQQERFAVQLERLEKHMDASLKQAITDIHTLFGDLSNALTALRTAQNANDSVTAEEQAAAADLESLVTSGHELLAPVTAAAGTPEPTPSPGATPPA